MLNPASIQALIGTFPPPKYALYGPGFPATVSGNPRKMPGFGGHPEVGYKGLFCKNIAYLPPDFDPQNGRFFISGILWLDQREIGHRRRDSGHFRKGSKSGGFKGVFWRENGDLGMDFYDERRFPGERHTCSLSSLMRACANRMRLPP